MKGRFLVWLGWLVAACMPVEDPGEGFFMYPPGFQWRVRWVMDLSPAPGSSPGLPAYHSAVEFTVREIRRRPIGESGTEVWTQVDHSPPGEYSVWWVTDTALIWVRGESVPFPWSPVGDSGYRYRIGGRTFTSVREVLRFLNRAVGGVGFGPLSPKDPQKTLRFPLTVGAEWVVFREPWLRVRRVVDVDTVTGPGNQEYWAWVVDTEDDLPNMDTLRDWLTNELWLHKLIRVTVEVFDEDGQYLGRVIVRETYQLLAAGESGPLLMRRLDGGGNKPYF